MKLAYKATVLIMAIWACGAVAQFSVEPWEEEDVISKIASRPKLERLADFRTRLESTYKACTLDVSKADMYPMALNRIDEARSLLKQDPPAQDAQTAFEKAWYASRASLLQFKALQMKARESALEIVVNSAMHRLDLARDSIGKLDISEQERLGLRKPVYAPQKETAAILDAVDSRLSSLNGSFVKVNKTSRGTVVTMSDLLFAPGEATLRDDLKNSLGRIADILKMEPDAQIVVEGHTDNVGNEGSNKKLSLDRANNVKQYLTSRGMIAASITAAGYGASRPIAPNDIEDNRQKNRRVELIIKNPPAN